MVAHIEAASKGEKALALAAKGFYVFPLHSIVQDGRCSCGAADCGKSAGKHPRIGGWQKAATVDPEQIRAWWRRWPDANIGIACGASRLLVLDLDLYKDAYTGEERLSGDDFETVTALTGGGGQHLYYRMPEGAQWGNATKGLPAGIDIRGVGGLIVAPGSLHRSGRAYEWEIGYSPDDLEPAAPPAWLADLLDAATVDGANAEKHAQAAAGAVQVDHERPALEQWQLTANVVALIVHGSAEKADRSRVEWGVVMALVRAGADDTEIAAVFQNYAIGRQGKYAEHGGRAYLARTIGKARAAYEQQAAAAAAVDAGQVEKAAQWAVSPSGRESLREIGYKRTEGALRTVCDVCVLLQKHRTDFLAVGIRSIAEAAGASASSVSGHLSRLAAGGWLTVQAGADGVFRVRLGQVLLEGASTGEGTEIVGLDDLAGRLNDCAFQAYPYAFAIKRRKAPTVLMAALGFNAVAVWGALAAGAEKTDEIAEETGLNRRCVGVVLRRMASAGVVGCEGTGEGNGRRWWLVDDAEERLQGIRAEMTTYGKQEMTALRNANARAARAHRQSVMAEDARSKARALHRRREQDDLSLLWAGVLEDMGINHKAPVRRMLPKMARRRVDPHAEFESIGRAAVALYDSLIDLPAAERWRKMEDAGFERPEVGRALRMRAKLTTFQPEMQ